MVTHQLQVEGLGKVRRSQTDVLPLCHPLCRYATQHKRVTLKPRTSSNNYWMSLTQADRCRWWRNRRCRFFPGGRRPCRPARARRRPRWRATRRWQRRCSAVCGGTPFVDDGWDWRWRGAPRGSAGARENDSSRWRESSTSRPNETVARPRGSATDTSTSDQQ